MKVGVPKEVKNHEYRVAITPAGVHELVRGGHQVYVQQDAGTGSAIPDQDYVTAGAEILPAADDVWQAGDLILKVKEPVAEEYHRMRDGQVLFTYLHLAASRASTEALLIDKNVARLRQADAIYQGHCQTVASNAYEIERAVIDADLVIGAVLVPGAKAPKLISNELVSRMKSGAVLVDISIDQGGCFEDSHPTTHADPTYKVHESVFYCVANMPGAVPHTSTYALTNVTLPYAVEIANRGWKDALAADPAFALGLNTHQGVITYRSVGEAHGLPWTPASEALS